MKRCLYSLILALLICAFIGVLTSQASADMYLVKKLKCHVRGLLSDRLTTREMDIFYNTKDKSLILYIDYPITPVYFPLEAPTYHISIRKTLIRYIQKYKEWSRKASRMQAKIGINKKIGKFTVIAVGCIFYNAKAEACKYATIHIGFLSPSRQKYLLTIDFDKLKAVGNKFLTYKPPTLYLFQDEVFSLEKAISDKTVKRYIIETTKEEKVFK